MEKEQRKNDFVNGYKSRATPEQYYNETFKSE
jgi:hypothetical protein